MYKFTITIYRSGSLTPEHLGVEAPTIAAVHERLRTQLADPGIRAYVVERDPEELPE